MTVRNRKGEVLTQAIWTDDGGKEVWVQITIVEGQTAKSIVVSGRDAFDFATALKGEIPLAEVRE